MSDSDELATPRPLSATATTPPIDLTQTEEVTLTRLKSVWHDDKVKDDKEDGKTGWRCLWCNKFSNPKHATRALCHLLKISGQGIAICKAIIPPLRLERYRALRDLGIASAECKKRGLEEVHDHVASRQLLAVAQLTVKRSKTSTGGAAASSNSLGFNAATKKHPFAKPNTHPSNQPSIVASVQNATMTQQSILQSNNTELEAIADLFHCENIPDSTVQSARFAIVLKKARLVGNDFKMPGRKMIGGPLLALNYKTCFEENKSLILKNADVYGLTWLGDGATIHRMPLLNILTMCGDAPPMVVSIHDCTAHMAAGGKKDAPYISDLFEEQIVRFDKEKMFTDLVYFDGAANVQKAGRMLNAKYPRAYALTGGEHVISSFFSDLVKMGAIKILVLKCCRLYNVFSSGATHGIYAQFIAQTSMANKGKKIGLLRGASTRFATWFYAMMRLLRLKGPLLATIHQAKFRDLDLNNRVRSAVMDIEDKLFWKALYILLRAVFPMLRALRYCDSNTPAMDKIFYLSHRATESIMKSGNDLNDETLFGTLGSDDELEAEADEVFGEKKDESTEYTTLDVDLAGESDDNEEENSGDGDDDEDDDSNSTTSSERLAAFFESSNVGSGLGKEVASRWNHRKDKLEHDVSITAWALSVHPAVRADVASRMTGSHRDAIERYVIRLHVAPCPNPQKKVHKMSEALLIDTFWNEYRHFNKKTDVFDKTSRWNSPDVQAGNSHVWHENYSLPHTKVLGFVACRCTSKTLGIGPTERAWGGVKHIKSGKRSNLGAASTEMRSVQYCTARVTEARIMRDAMKQIDAGGPIEDGGPDGMFGDDDINFDLQLEEFGIDLQALKEPSTQRVFRAWVEEWEIEIMQKNDCVAEAQLLEKYKDLVFYDPDNKCNYTIHNKNLQFSTKRKERGWYLIGIPSNEELDDEPFEITLVNNMIADTQQADGVEIIRLDGESGAEDTEGGGDNEEEPV